MAGRLCSAALPFAKDVLAVIMERDRVRLGFSLNGRDPTQEGAAIEVTDIERARVELRARGVEPRNWRIDHRGGKDFQIFLAVAPDGLCFNFFQPIGPISEHPGS